MSHESPTVEEDPPKVKDWKLAIYRHPLYTVLEFMVQKCATATHNVESKPCEDLIPEVSDLLCKIRIDKKKFLTDDNEVDELMILGIKVLRHQLSELEKVREISDVYVNRSMRSIQSTYDYELTHWTRNEPRPTYSPSLERLLMMSQKSRMPSESGRNVLMTQSTVDELRQRSLNPFGPPDEPQSEITPWNVQPQAFNLTRGNPLIPPWSRLHLKNLPASHDENHPGMAKIPVASASASTGEMKADNFENFSNTSASPCNSNEDWNGLLISPLPSSSWWPSVPQNIEGIQKHSMKGFHTSDSNLSKGISNELEELFRAEEETETKFSSFSNFSNIRMN